VESIKQICMICSYHKIPIFYEPTSMAKCIKIIKAKALHQCTYTSPNISELIEMSDAITGKKSLREENDLESLKNHSDVLLNEGCKFVLTTMGGRGVLLASKDINLVNQYKHIPALPAHVVKVTGAGDTLVGGVIHGLLLGKTLEESVEKYGILAAKLCIESRDIVPPTILATFTKLDPKIFGVKNK